MERATRFVLTVIVAGIVGVALFWQQSPAPLNNASAEIVVLDVGQGDAIYIRDSQGDDILIDGGPDNTVIKRLHDVMPATDTTLELVISTHPDADHSAGLVSVFEHYNVQQVIINDLPAVTKTYQRLLEVITEEGSTIIHSQAGDHWQLSEYENLTVVYPFSRASLSTLSTNDTSIIMRYEYQGSTHTTSALFMGDASDQVEQQLVGNQLVGPVDILKVGHHGSAHSSSAEFLTTLQPRFAAISVGVHNSYGHPTDVVLQRLGKYATILRTDQQGSIRFLIQSDGQLVVDQSH